MTDSDIGDLLAARLSAVFGEDVRVEDLRRLTAGANSETWSFTAHRTAGVSRLILRRQPGAMHGPLGMTRESEAISAAAKAGVPVPTVVEFSDDAAALGAPYLVCEHIDGETIPRKLLRDDRYAQARTGMAAELGRTLARIHSIPLSAVPALQSGVRSGLDELRQSYLDLDTPSAVTEIALAALSMYQPEPVGETVVHGDFRNGNLLISDSGLEAVLDWELTHIGDPREDLGWLLVKCWRFGTAPEVGGFGTVDDLLDGYAEVAGVRPDIEAVRWWQLYRTVWWSIVCAQMAQRHLSGGQRSVELAAIGRRVCEQEHDILLALGRPATAVPDTPAATTEPGLHGQPTAAELVNAVSEWLRTTVMPDAAAGSTRFEARVAANVLDIVERELAAGDIPLDRRRAALEELGFESETDLAIELRAGRANPRDPRIIAVVRASVTERLLVANPRYLEQ
ncbi:phosphotransferase family protein [Williamsia sp.]|uniref:phosphotransferase family protein n=1 Tax=Williamsia sp. TaxID=1872085 RepID=UPI002F9347E9